MESGAVLPGSGLNLTWTYEPWFQQIADEAGCSQTVRKLDCLRRTPFTVLNNILNTTANDTTPYNWRPTVDGDFVARYPSEQLDRGDFVKVPIIIGYTTDEGTTECPEPVNTTTELKNYLSCTYLPTPHNSSLPAKRVTQQQQPTAGPSTSASYPSYSSSTPTPPTSVSLHPKNSAAM